MDRRNIYVCALGMALVLGFAGSASAQEDETTQQIDWEDAARYAVLMDEFVGDDDVAMETYYDEAQDALWSQPASMTVEEATAELAEDPEGAGLDSITQWVVPTLLWLCDYNESADPGCDDYGNNYKWASGEFTLARTSGYYAYYDADWKSNSYAGIDRIRAKGSSNVADYCDAYFLGSYYSGSGFDPAEEDSCGSIGSYYWYELDDSDHITNRTYDGYNGEYVARFRFYADSTYYYSVISVDDGIE